MASPAYVVIVLTLRDEVRAEDIEQTQNDGTTPLLTPAFVHASTPVNAQVGSDMVDRHHFTYLLLHILSPCRKVGSGGSVIIYFCTSKRLRNNIGYSRIASSPSLSFEIRSYSPYADDTEVSFSSRYCKSPYVDGDIWYTWRCAVFSIRNVHHLAIALF